MSRKDRTGLRAVRFKPSAIAKRSAILSITLLMLMLAVSVTGARAAGDETIDDTFPASVTQAGVYANENTGETPSISADGRYVAFESDATNLSEESPPAPPGVYEAYVKDLDTGEVTLVSRANGVDGEPANEPGEAAGVENLAISGNGQYVIFTSDASNLVTGLPTVGAGEEHPWHIYRRDLQTGETALVDRVTGTEGAILDEGNPHAEAISEEGRYVLFRDHVEDLENPSGAHEPGLQMVYVRDMQTGTTTTVSRADGAGGELANEASWGRSISPGGRYVTFEGSATNLVPGMESNTVSQVYLRDLQTDTTTLISKTPAGEPGNESSEEPILAGADGCEVTFQSAATNLYLWEGKAPSAPQIYLTDLRSTLVSTTLVSRADGEDGAPVGEGGGVTNLGASADGRYILFEATLDPHGTGSAAENRLYVRDLSTGHTTLVDRAGGAEGELANEQAQQGEISAAISANGCRVAFVTRATNLSEPGPPLNDPYETYIRNLALCEPPAAEEHHQGTEETHSGEDTGNGANPSGDEPNSRGQLGATAPNAVGAGPAGAGTACVVPTMRALDLTAIQRALSAAHCALGHVTYHYNAIPKGGLVEQSLHQGTVRPAGTKVNIWLSKGHNDKWRASHRKH
jgi:Tol biopolymer transport system component